MKIYNRYDYETDVEKPSLTVGDLIRILSNLDPKMKVALRGPNGGDVRSIGEIEIDSIYTATNDPSYATRGLYLTRMGNIKFSPLGNGIIID